MKVFDAATTERYLKYVEAHTTILQVPSIIQYFLELIFLIGANPDYKFLACKVHISSTWELKANFCELKK